MIILKHISKLNETLASHRKDGYHIGFVPTMGALHKGHLSLIKASQKSQQITVCSIFVNPTQFNNASDFAKYPITLEHDILALEKVGCDILFLPSVAEMYPDGEVKKHYQLGEIELVLETAHRPGHFQGVCQIVDKLLQAVQPNTLFLGQKDFQQCIVIRRMMEITNHICKLEIVQTVREPDGLAMSSRNMRLSPGERITAHWISKVLLQIKDKLVPGNTDLLELEAAATLEEKGFSVDYVAVCDTENLKQVHDWDGRQKIVALAAATIGDTRLIDNILLN